MFESKKEILVSVLIVAILLSLTWPQFLNTYRNWAFNTAPRDDYAPYLLYLVGEENGVVPASPTGYRLFSVALAVPFYLLAPPFRFSRLGQVDYHYLRATQALAMTYYASTVITSLIMFLIARRRFRASVMSSVMASLITYFLSQIPTNGAVDPTAIMVISLLVYLMDNPIMFPLMMFASIGINEKIPLLFSLLFLSRAIVRASVKGYQLTSSILAAGMYFVMRLLVGLPGHEHQATLSAFFASFADTLPKTLSAKGVMVNIIPVGLLIFIYVLATMVPKDKYEPNFFSRVDIVPSMGLFLLGHMTRLEYTVGRIVLYCFPLYLPLASRYVGDYLQSFDSPVPDDAPHEPGIERLFSTEKLDT